MDTEKLIEKTTEALERCVMQCMEHDCCLGSAHDTINDDPRSVLRSAFAEVRREAIEEAIATAEHHVNHWDGKHTDRCREARAIKCDLQALLPPAVEEKIQCGSVSFGGCQCELEHGHGGPHEADKGMKRWQQ